MNTFVTGHRLARELGEWRGNAPAYQSLAERIRVLLLDGRLSSGARMPAERELSQALDLSRTTVAAAYSKLREDGFLESVRGSGSTLCLPGMERGEHSLHSGLPFDFTKATAPAYPGLQCAYASALAELPNYLSHDGFDMVGLPDLREAIAQHFADRGLPTSADQIMVTIGAQHGLNLVARTLYSPGERILVEQPTYPHALDTFTSLGARILAFPVRAESGWDVQQALLQIRRAAPSMAYLMPDFHNPTGLSMSIAEREFLAAAADREGTILVVDETTALLDINRGPLPPMASFSPNIITLGSLGKLAWGGLRIGWIRSSREMQARILRNRPAVDLGTPIVEQLAALALFKDLPSMAASRSRELRRGRDTLVQLLQELLPQWSLNIPNGGLSLWINTETMSSSALALAARSQGLALVSGPRFGLDGAFERYLRLPFCYESTQLRHGVAILSDIAGHVGSEPLRLPQQAVI
ncbi:MULTISPECIES: PLP-dependent aminotransferase family protein [Arthrobacter]|uniref:PLP-dependent aminotransferase family protein n=1 Tax=Arthrobacter psychrochitiniphilus TaxID=291045 RepID=A0A2V3DP74_9MICC|nr:MULTISPECIES: PLP-dependent aminotransferase family protein [Arthrobacter]NYG17041.1 DNA-binding transcriptional MocR family regulator [Arthrobacter psychrochitiniphilus]PXA64745.1 PLP-dependent aminotransferase family protein [Arthrobacter psychrochitiniphilus]